MIKKCQGYKLHRSWNFYEFFKCKLQADGRTSPTPQGAWAVPCRPWLAPSTASPALPSAARSRAGWEPASPWPCVGCSACSGAQALGYSSCKMMTGGFFQVVVCFACFLYPTALYVIYFSCPVSFLVVPGWRRAPAAGGVQATFVSPLQRPARAMRPPAQQQDDEGPGACQGVPSTTAAVRMSQTDGSKELCW